MPKHVVTFNLGPAEVCSPAIFEVCVSNNKGKWFAVADYFMYFYIIVLFLFAAILQLINFTAS